MKTEATYFYVRQPFTSHKLLLLFRKNKNHHRQKLEEEVKPTSKRRKHTSEFRRPGTQQRLEMSEKGLRKQKRLSQNEGRENFKCITVVFVNFVKQSTLSMMDSSVATEYAQVEQKLDYEYIIPQKIIQHPTFSNQHV